MVDGSTETYHLLKQIMPLEPVKKSPKKNEEKRKKEMALANQIGQLQHKYGF